MIAAADRRSRTRHSRRSTARRRAPRRCFASARCGHRSRAPRLTPVGAAARRPDADLQRLGRSAHSERARPRAGRRPAALVAGGGAGRRARRAAQRSVGLRRPRGASFLRRAHRQPDLPAARRAHPAPAGPGRADPVAPRTLSAVSAVHGSSVARRQDGAGGHPDPGRRVGARRPVTRGDGSCGFGGLRGGRAVIRRPRETRLERYSYVPGVEVSTPMPQASSPSRCACASRAGRGARNIALRLPPQPDPRAARRAPGRRAPDAQISSAIRQLYAAEPGRRRRARSRSDAAPTAVR